MLLVPFYCFHSSTVQVLLATTLVSSHSDLIHINQHLNETAHCAYGSLMKALYCSLLYNL